MLLYFQIGKEKYNATRQTCKANNGNDKHCKAVVYKQQVYCRNQNTAPNRSFDKLANAVELNKVGGEYHFPNHKQRKNDENPPMRTAGVKVHDWRCYGNPQKGPTYNIEHSLSVARYFCDFGICVFNVHSIHSLLPRFQFRHL